MVVLPAERPHLVVPGKFGRLWTALRGAAAFDGTRARRCPPWRFSYSPDGLPTLGVRHCLRRPSARPCGTLCRARRGASGAPSGENAPRPRKHTSVVQPQRSSPPRDPVNRIEGALTLSVRACAHRCALLDRVVRISSTAPRRVLRPSVHLQPVVRPAPPSSVAGSVGVPLVRAVARRARSHCQSRSSATARGARARARTPFL